MKKFVFACLVSMLASSLCTINVTPLFAHSHEAKQCDMSADQKLKTLTKKLSLNKDQQAQVKTILDAEMPKDKTSMSADQCKMMDDKIKAVLTDKQKAKYDKMCAADGKQGAACCMPVSSKSK